MSPMNFSLLSCRRMTFSFSVLKFMQRYLGNKKQRAKINSTSACWENITIAIPQGFVKQPVMSLQELTTCKLQLGVRALWFSKLFKFIYRKGRKTANCFQYGHLCYCSAFIYDIIVNATKFQRFQM